MTHLEFDCTDDKATFILKAARLYDEGLRDIPEWTPCSERMPKAVNLDEADVEDFMEAYCLVADGKAVVTAIYDNGTFLDPYDFNPFHGVVAWMPLPKSYKKGE